MTGVSKITVGIRSKDFRGNGGKLKNNNKKVYDQAFNYDINK